MLNLRGNGGERTASYKVNEAESKAAEAEERFGCMKVNVLLSAGIGAELVAGNWDAMQVDTCSWTGSKLRR